MTGFLEEREIQALSNDIEKSSVELNGFRESFARQMMNGMGQDMVEELTKPKREGFWTKLMKKLRRTVL